MQELPITVASTPSSVPFRLLLAFLLGLPLGPLPFAPDWIQWFAPITVLVVALLLSIQLDPLVRSGTITAEHAVHISLLSLFLIGVVVGTMAILLALGTGFIGLTLIPLGVSLFATFAVGSTRNLWWQSISYGLTAWLGVTVHLLIGIFVISTLPGNTSGYIVFVLTLIEVIVGMVIAIPGAFLGRVLRIGLLGDR